MNKLLLTFQEIKNRITGFSFPLLVYHGNLMNQKLKLPKI